jgi:hypothetical protein
VYLVGLSYTKLKKVVYKSFSEEALGHTIMSARNFFLKPEVQQMKSAPLLGKKEGIHPLSRLGLYPVLPHSGVVPGKVHW